MNTAEIILNESGGIAAYSEFRSQLATLRAENSALVFDYADEKGNKDARSHIHKLRRTKGAVDAARKTEKQSSLDYGRRVDSEAKEIIEQIEAMIEIHERPIKEIEERETARKQAILNRMGQIVAYGEIDKSLPAAALTVNLMNLQSIEISEWFAENMAAATKLKKEAEAYLLDAISQAEKREAEALELTRLREAEAARIQSEREQRIALEAAAKATADAEAAAERGRIAAESAAKREQEAAAARERAERERADKAVAEAKDAEERAARAAREAVERERREAAATAKAEQEAAAKREADKKHRSAINNAALSALVDHAGISDDQARRVVEAIAKRLVPAVTISY